MKPKAEIRNDSHRLFDLGQIQLFYKTDNMAKSAFGFRISAFFQGSEFGLRIWDFGFCTPSVRAKTVSLGAWRLEFSFIFPRT